MTFFTNNNEADPTALYGDRHRPTYIVTLAGYFAGCTCGCDRATDGHPHPTWVQALDAARTGLRLAHDNGGTA